MQSEHDFPLLRLSPELAEGKPLPGAQSKSSARDRNRDGAANHDCFDVSGHVIWTFVRMNVGGTLRRDAVKRRIQIRSHGGIRILAHGQSCRSVKDEEIQETCFRKGAETVLQALFNFPGDQVKAFGETGQQEIALLNHSLSLDQGLPVVRYNSREHRPPGG